MKIVLVGILFLAIVALSAAQTTCPPHFLYHCEDHIPCHCHSETQCRTDAECTHVVCPNHEDAVCLAESHNDEFCHCENPYDGHANHGHHHHHHPDHGHGK